MAALFKTRKRAPAPRDFGLDEIHAWHDWFVGAHQRRLHELALAPEVQAREFEAITTLAAAMRERMTSDYLSRRHHS